MTTRAAVSPRYLLSCALSLTGNSVAGVILPLVLLATTGDALAAGTLALIWPAVRSSTASTAAMSPSPPTCCRH